MNDLHLSLNFIFYVKKYKVLYSLKLGVNFTDVDILRPLMTAISNLKGFSLCATTLNSTPKGFWSKTDDQSECTCTWYICFVDIKVMIYLPFTGDSTVYVLFTF